MGTQGKHGIAWTNETWNPVTGCTKVSQGCKNCYAETIANRFWGDRKFTDVICHKDRLDQPLHWRKPRMVFVNSMSDLFHDDVPFEFVDEIMETMKRADWHTYQILTKRPERCWEWIDERAKYTTYGFPRHVWIGVSVEDNEHLRRVEFLRGFPAGVRFISFEPLLEDVGKIDLTGIHWVIVGGESGWNARTMKLDWARQIRDECAKRGTAFFMKQMSEHDFPFGGYKDFPSFPKDLRIRQFPNT